jgi:predicted nucleic acid-binding protein
MAIVVDASVAVGWIARTQATPLTSAALSLVAREFGCVPSYFGIEVARALRHHERRNLLTADLVDRVSDIIALARRHGLRIADAAYLELAVRTALPLATRDVSLARAAEATGVVLFKS